MLNDYFDFVLGVDTRPEHGSGVLTGGHMTARQTLVFGVTLLAGTAACGLFVGVNRVAVVVPLALLGLGCVVLYPAVLKKYALGDLLIVLRIKPRILEKSLVKHCNFLGTDSKLASFRGQGQ